MRRPASSWLTGSGALKIEVIPGRSPRQLFPDHPQLLHGQNHMHFCDE
jgi:hypothetical protein